MTYLGPYDELNFFLTLWFYCYQIMSNYLNAYKLFYLILQ